MDADFILRRASDLLILGVRWQGMSVIAGPALEASGADAAITVVFPPQHTAEQVQAPLSEPLLIDAVPVWRSQLSATSHVTFRIAPGTVVPLTVEGILAAVRHGAYDRANTVIELPWRLHIAPGAAHWLHADVPVEAPDGTVGLWRTRASRTTTLGQGGADLELFTIVDPAVADLDPFPLALTRADRGIIAPLAALQPARASRLELTSLGGTLTAIGRWADAEWDHDAALGRDIHVRTVARLHMFPFGHRAELSSVTERVFDPATGDAVLVKVTTLQFTEPLVTMRPDGDRTRMFPFDEVEVLQTTYTDLPAEQDWTTLPRGSGILADLQARRDAAGSRVFEIEPFVLGETTRDRSIEELAGAGFTSASRFLDLMGAVSAIDAELAPAEEAWAAAGPIFDQIGQLQQQLDVLSNTPVGPDGFLDPGVVAEMNQISQEISNLNQQVANLPNLNVMAQQRAQREAFQNEANQHFAAFEPELTRDRSIEELAQSGLAEAAELLQLRVDIATLDQEIAAETAKSVFPHPWHFTPHDVRGIIQFPVRMRGPEGEVMTSIPMVAVRAFGFPAEGTLPAFDSLTDPALTTAVQTRWTAAGAGEAPIAPTRIDLIRSVVRAPGDVRVVHGLKILGDVLDGAFLPRLDAFDLELPEVSTLLKEMAPTRYRYATQFLLGETEDLVFETVGEAVALNFGADARNAGALLSPSISADGLSRSLGPVNVAGILSEAAGMFDPEKVFAEGATLLGFELADLVKELDKLPEILTHLQDGRPPIVTMTWEDVPLDSFGPFIANDSTRLTLEMESGPDESFVRCKVTDFALALPTPDLELLRLNFSEVRFRQELGESPDLAVEGLTAEFKGPLMLLQVLQDAVTIGDDGPTIGVTPSGIVARYLLPLPDVTAGAFQLSNLSFRAGVDVPFGSTPPSISIGFASRQSPFVATVLMFGGGGYIELAIDHTGIRRLEAAIEFGAALAIDFFVASAEVHVLGGIRYEQRGDAVELTGYLRIGGSVQILGLISLSIELLVALSYRSETNALVGRATLVIELDLTFYSTSVELDSGPWTISGGSREIDAGDGRTAAGVEDPARAVDEWREYRRAFA